MIRGYTGELQDFVEAVAYDREPASDFALAYDTTRVLYAAYQSRKRAGGSILKRCKTTPQELFSSLSSRRCSVSSILKPNAPDPGKTGTRGGIVLRFGRRGLTAPPAH